MESFDFIVVGAGSAGCVIATRLVEAGKSVLLLEAGPDDNHLFVHIPAALQKLQSTGRLWTYRTEEEKHVAGRRVPMKTGRTVGGGSSVNGMVYIRGRPQDYDGWRSSGCVGWGWDDVLPVYRRMENNQRLSGELHGSAGPLKISDPPYRHPLSSAFVNAAMEAGLPFNPDFNGAQQRGVGFYQTTSFDGLRQSSAVAYLARVRKNRLLRLLTHATVQKIELENGAAVGVQFTMKDGQSYNVRARNEVVLSAGTFGSAKLLQLSGIGPAAVLASAGIAIRRDLPGVGANLQEHFQAGVFAQARRPDSLRGEDKGLRAVRHGVEWLLLRRGLLTSNVIEAGGFVDTRGDGDPDVQLTMVPALTGDADRAPHPGHGISVSPCVLRPTSRGVMEVVSADPRQPPRIRANALSTREDIDTLVRGLRIVRRIMATSAMSAIASHELAPGRDFGEPVTDEALESHARRFAKTIYHPVGTCKMGVDAESVVDPKLRVHGVPRLRVGDASIMPAIVSGNTNGPAMMIGERCAAFLLQ